jgi:ATP-dependent helicase/nuclease subunit A
MTVMDEATLRQLEAARPDASTWLSANAGSGKTRVLTDRVARLLLDEVEPQHILCLTYTKAAASEMQNRLFKRLGAWAMLPDAELAQSLTDLGAGHATGTDALRRARTLFASAIETPGGLKIQTIHSFCAALLRRFPLEAQVSPQFTEIEDRAADMLRADIVDQMALGGESAVVRALATQYTGEDFGKLTREIVGQQAGFSPALDWAGCLNLFDLPADLTADAVAARVLLGNEADILGALIPHLLVKGGNDAKAGHKLQQINRMDLSALSVMEEVFLTGVSAKEPFTAKLGSFPTKPTQAKVADLMPALEDLMRRVEDTRALRLAFGAARKTHSLHQFAQPFLDRYAQAKQLRGWLDFDDLINKARSLLYDKKVAAWVLYRIDGGIDHILVDEAQDTSPAQWDVVRKLTEEFASGDGARADVLRTVFVVGDTKQSIYSFQGADPREFHRMQQEFQTRIEGAGQLFQERTLDFSFRSSPAVLRLVDTCFSEDAQPGFAKQAQHIAFKTDLPGRVDLWPFLEKATKEEENVWYDPVDRLSPTHHNLVLAHQVADHLQHLMENETIPDDGDTPGTYVRRKVRAGDFLILVQRRSTLFSEIIRACKARGLPIAGADRLKVGGELAVKDLAALLSFLATPEDSLSLATVLRSPLFGWTEQQLFGLAHTRSQTHLWPALRDRAAEFPETYAVLRDLRDNVDYLRPYDLIERILTRHDGRRKLLGRLGVEAEDGIDAMLSQALAYERTDVPSLTGFLVWMRTDQLEIKRQIDSASDQIRVMTVHGSKGLEAPIVILPDTAKRDIRVLDEVIDAGGHPVWRPKAAEMPKMVADTMDRMKQDIAEERLRLLYVALTRAEKWLIIAGAGEAGKNGDSWYEIAQTALGQMGAVDTLTDQGTIQRFSHGDWNAPPLVELPPKVLQTAQVDPLFGTAARRPPEPPKTLSPSDLGGAKALAGDLGTDEDAAKSFGSAVHLLLERMAGRNATDWPAIIDVCRSDYVEMPGEIWETATGDARAVLHAPHLAGLFTKTTLAEVPVTANLGPERLHGVIDRLLVYDDHILAIDYKTNRVVPATPEDCPDGLLLQMGAYAQALSQVFSGKRIEVAILWTTDQTLMPLPATLVMTALQRAGYLDDPMGAT